MGLQAVMRVYFWEGDPFEEPQWGFAKKLFYKRLDREKQQN